MRASWGTKFLRMRDQSYQSQIAGRVAMTLLEIRAILCRSPGWIRDTVKLFARYWTDLPWRFRSRRDRNMAMGNALAGSLGAGTAQAARIQSGHDSRESQSGLSS